MVLEQPNRFYSKSMEKIIKIKKKCQKIGKIEVAKCLIATIITLKKLINKFS
jgi:hypothetical protein